MTTTGRMGFSNCWILAPCRFCSNFSSELASLFLYRLNKQGSSQEEALPAVARNRQLGNDSSTTVSLCQVKTRDCFRGFLPCFVGESIETRKSPAWEWILVLTMVMIAMMIGNGRRSYVLEFLRRRQRVSVRPSSRKSSTCCFVTISASQPQQRSSRGRRSQIP
jgi:hypothetical protein